MRTIAMEYEHRSAAGTWIPRKYVTSDGKDWERVVGILHQNTDEYRILSVKHEEV